MRFERCVRPHLARRRPGSPSHRWERPQWRRFVGLKSNQLPALLLRARPTDLMSCLVSVLYPQSPRGVFGEMHMTFLWWRLVEFDGAGETCSITHPTASSVQSWSCENLARPIRRADTAARGSTASRSRRPPSWAAHPGDLNRREGSRIRVRSRVWPVRSETARGPGKGRL
jgi:hypothetical protein